MILSNSRTETSAEKYSGNVLMKNEWSRYQSFATFPVESVMMPMRLSQAGFYYAGKGEKATCFCCGLQITSWTEGDNVMEVHWRLSPHCRYVCGEEVGNIAIHGDFRIIPSYTKGPAVDSKKGFQKKRSNSKCKDVEVAGSVYQNYGREDIVSVPGVSSNYQNELMEQPFVSHQRENKRLEKQKPTSVLNLNGQIELYPGITNEKPKCTDYALRSSRLTSFTEWPANHVVDPSTLAAAGFYYAGFQDCVRCFFCNCGMKNWEFGDKPWVEHARWSPECEYVKLCKGNTFVNVCRAAICSENLHSFDEEHVTQENIPDDSLIIDINSVAAKLVLHNGYSQRDVEKCVLNARQKYDGELKTQYVMEFMLETNEQPSKMKADVTRVNKRSYKTEAVCEGTETNVPFSFTKSMQETSEPSQILSRNREDQSHIQTEKKRLMEENRRLKDLITCKICMDSDACVAFLPCGHLTTCIECSKNLRNCVICRTLIQGSVRIYQA